jgi:hypothetical protein
VNPSRPPLVLRVETPTRPSRPPLILRALDAGYYAAFGSWFTAIPFVGVWKATSLAALIGSAVVVGYVGSKMASWLIGRVMEAAGWLLMDFAPTAWRAAKGWWHIRRLRRDTT